MKEFHPGKIWLKRVPLRFFGLHVGTRMTVIRLGSGDLFLHSPVKLDRQTRGAIDRLGPVRFVVAPNKLHHLFLADYFTAYPEAKVFAAPGLPERRTDLKFHGVLGDAPEPGWAAEIDQAIFRGSIFMEEVVFFHCEAGTLIVADLLEWANDEDGVIERFAARLAGIYKRPGLSRDQRLLVRDRAAARASIEKMLAWDFDRIILAHGRLVERGGKQVFREAFSWLTR